MLWRLCWAQETSWCGHQTSTPSHPTATASLRGIKTAPTLCQSCLSFTAESFVLSSFAGTGNSDVRKSTGIGAGRRCVDSLVALTPSTSQNGALLFAPGSHKKGQLTHTENCFASVQNMLSRGQSVPQDVVEEALANSTQVECVLQPGEATLHHLHTLHASTPNASSSRRVGFAVRFMSSRVHKAAGLACEAATLVWGEA
eukprot:2254848-Rhodomonas_salina.3